MKTLCCLLSAFMFFWAGHAKADAQNGQGYASPLATFIDDDEDRVRSRFSGHLRIG